jgi:DNA-directed RNA polymerase subunit alpha
MTTLNCIETYIDKDQNHYGCFLIEPLETGQGITVGNALRRTLLSDLSGFAIVGVRINNVKHEFSNIEGLREDILEVLLNLKEIVFKYYHYSSKEINSPKFTGFLNVRGPIILTAGMFNLPKDSLRIINPNQYIGTIVDNSEFYMEIDIENGKGYRLTEETRKKNLQPRVSNQRPSTLFVDAVFMPIRKVNYKIRLIHDTKGNIKESLNLEIWTNGSMTPKRSIQEALKIIMDLFYGLFLTPNFLTISSEFSSLVLNESTEKS